MLSFLKKIHEALDSDPNSEIVAFYTDFSKAFYKVPDYELIQKVAQIGVGGVYLKSWSTNLKIASNLWESTTVAPEL